MTGMLPAKSLIMEIPKSLLMFPVVEAAAGRDDFTCKQLSVTVVMF